MNRPSPVPHDGARPSAARTRSEAARRALSEGIERSRRLVDRYRALLVQLHEPFANPRVVRARQRAERARLK